jgi:hypothetical protein
MNKIGIGLRFTHSNKDGVVLQTCNILPKHHNRENEVGPFYGVHYDGGNYTWYSEQELIKLQNNK